MKTTLPKAINTIPEARKLLKELYDNDESFHPEDDANDLSCDLFTKEEGDHLNKLMNDIYEFKGNENHQAMIFDPCGYLLELSGHVMEFEEGEEEEFNIEFSLAIKKFQNFKKELIKKGFAKNHVIKKGVLRNFKSKIIDGSNVHLTFTCSKEVREIFITHI